MNNIQEKQLSNRAKRLRKHGMLATIEGLVFAIAFMAIIFIDDMYGLDISASVSALILIMFVAFLLLALAGSIMIRISKSSCLNKKACPNCGEDIDANAHFCSNCGINLTKECPNCKRSCKHHDQFCADCGSKLK